MDLTKTVNIDSLAIGYLVKLNRKMKKYGRILFLTNLNEHIQKIFRLTNMDKYFKIMQNFNDKDFFH